MEAKPARSYTPDNTYTPRSRSERTSEPSARPAPVLTPAEVNQRAVDQLQATTDPATQADMCSNMRPELLADDQRASFYTCWIYALHELKRYPQLVTVYEQAPKTSDSDVDQGRRQCMVEAYYHTGAYQRGITVFNTPKPAYSTTAAYYLLLCQANLGGYDASMAELARLQSYYQTELPSELRADVGYQLARCRLYASSGTPAQRAARFQLATDGFTDYLATPAGQQAPRDARTLRALAYYSLADYASCVADLTEDLQLNPRNTTALYWRGEAHTEQQHYAAALADQTVLLGYDDRPAVYWNARARTRCLSGDFAGGLADTRETLRRDSTSADAPRYLGTRGYARAGLGDYAAAAADYSRALRPTPSGLIYLLRGKARLAQGQIVLARADFVEALALGVSGHPTLTTADAQQLLAATAGKAPTTPARKARH